MKPIVMVVGFGAVLLLAAAPAMADWDQGDPFKMHFPQLPDPNGWDIDMTNYVLADDWQCNQTGTVDDIHFWYSVEHQTSPTPPPHFLAVQVSIHDDIPDPDGNGPGYSMPGNLLRQWTFDSAQFLVAGPWNGEQGWDNPEPNTDCIDPDHLYYWQVNITKISSMVTDPFRQDVGKVYWLDLQVQTDANNPLVGWKTTYEDLHFNDFAVYKNPASGAVAWLPIAVCRQNMPTDLAFVITPEPATAALLVGGGVAFMMRRRRRRR